MAKHAKKFSKSAFVFPEKSTPNKLGQEIPTRFRGAEIMTVSADTKEELDETLTEHSLDGWREISRKSDRDGTFHARLTR